MFIDSPTHRICGDGSAVSAVAAAGDASHGACGADADADAGPLAGADAVAGAFGGVDLGALSNSGLEDRVVGLVGLRARVEGEYLAALGEMTSRYGSQSTAYQLRDLTRMNGPQSRSESRLAESLAEHDLAATLDALKAGEIQTSHARVIAREAPKKHRRSEADFLELCRTYTSDTVARHPLAYESEQVYADLEAEAAAAGLGPIDAELALQRQQRSGSLRLGDDGMWDLRAKLDYITGRQLSAMLQAAVRSLRHRAADDNSNAGIGVGVGVGVEPTRAQLTADAISDLIAGKLNVRRATTSLLILADYDCVNDRLANPRLDDGTPLSPQMLADLAVDANVLPAVFSADWSQTALGRTRNANDAQRLILAARDRGCIGCELTSEHTQAHHIQYYENDGLTDTPNLASLCESCHHDLHAHDRQIHTPPNGRPRLQPPEPNNTGPSDPEPAAARSP